MSVNSRRPVRESAIWQAYSRSRYAALFYTLLFMLVIWPAAATIGLPQVGIKLLLGACLLAALMPNATKRTAKIFIAAAVVLMALRFGSEQGMLPITAALIVIMWGVIGLIAAGAALRFAVTTPGVDSETVYSALSTYLLAGLFFGQIYSALEQIHPGSVTGPDTVSDIVCVYYSFVTLATLGYGDYLPRTDIARGIAVLEVIGGQLFLAVMVARLIGAFKLPGAKT